MSERTRRTYPITTLRRAQELRAAGSTPTEIQWSLVREGHPEPAIKTIQRWVSPSYDAQQRRDVARAKGRARKRRLLALGAEMKAAGLSYTAIAWVFAHYEDVTASPDTIRRWLTMNGVPKNEKKRRAMTERHAAT